MTKITNTKPTKSFLPKTLVTKLLLSRFTLTSKKERQLSYSDSVVKTLKKKDSLISWSLKERLLQLFTPFPKNTAAFRTKTRYHNLDREE